MKYYFGNNPGSANYDPNIPVGWNHWDASEINYDEDWEEEDIEEPEEDIEKPPEENQKSQ